MKIDFEAIVPTDLEAYLGGEGLFQARIYTDGVNKILRGSLKPGASLGLHTHEGNCEIIYVLSGTGKVEYEGEMEALAAGSCHYCPQGKTHRLINDGKEDLEVFAVIPRQ